jgi:hypothetical protein
MFTVLMRKWTRGIGDAVDGFNVADREEYDSLRDTPDELWRLVLHIRQDIKFIVFLLRAVIVARSGS